MKKILFLLLIITQLTSCCKKNNDEPTNPIDQLPAATQTGANTFGCLLDGEAFLPGNYGNPLDCVYQFVSGGFYFTLQANRRDSDSNLVLLALSTNTLQIHQNQSYSL